MSKDILTTGILTNILTNEEIITKNYGDKVNKELEVRFKPYYLENLDIGHDPRIFNRVLSFFEKLNKNNKTEEIEDEIILGEDDKLGSIRKNKLGFEKKTQVYRSFNTNYNFLISLSIEEKIENVDNFMEMFIRKRKRKSFYLSDENRVDFTVVEQQNLKTGKRNIKYEIELEILKNRKTLHHITNSIKIVLKVLLETNEIYTVNEKRDLVGFFNNTLSENRNNTTFDPKVLNQVRNLKFKDVVWGGIVGGNYTYSVTVKADGERYQLILYKTGIWLVRPPYDANLITRREMSKFVGTIMDGEIIKRRKKNAPISKYWFLVFDLLSGPVMDNRHLIKGNISMQRYDHKIRMHTAASAAEYIKIQDVPENLIFVDTSKNFISFTDSPSFFSAVQNTYRRSVALPYYNDGLIFIPIETSYREASSDAYNLNQRFLTMLPDQCKIKPKELLTIDLAVDIKNEKVYCNDPNKGLRLFNGDKINELKNVDWNNKIFQSNSFLSLNYPVIEFQIDTDNDKLIPLKLREDKPKPNNYLIALNNWSSAYNGIRIEDIEGKNLSLYRKHFRRVSRERLFKASLSLLKNTFGSSDLNLLEIGSNKGQNAPEWEPYSKIYAVEPDKEPLAELEKRANFYNLDVTIINTAGENTQELLGYIKPRSIHIITMILSLSFFWENKEKLLNLVKTIKTFLVEGGIFSFMTIDGERVNNLRNDNTGRGGSIIEFINKQGTINLKFPKDKNDNSYFIEMKGTVVKQKEYLVKLDELTELLGEEFKLIDTEDVAKEKLLLPYDQRIWTNMYIWGIYVREN